eukprot:m.228439 g.228439  ORF g.228439 m.228439 type:complete len:525 (-) comp15979_c0_seq2:2720-4294(-)
MSSRFDVGDTVEAQDCGAWFAAVIIGGPKYDRKDDSIKYKVHYKGYKKSSDRWLPDTSEFIQPVGTFLSVNTDARKNTGVVAVPENEFIVEEIRDERIKEGKIEYFVKWLGYEEHAGGLTWEPEELVGDCAALDKYEAKKRRRQRHTSKRQPLESLHEEISRKQPRKGAPKRKNSSNSTFEYAQFEQGIKPDSPSFPCDSSDEEIEIEQTVVDGARPTWLESKEEPVTDVVVGPCILLLDPHAFLQARREKASGKKKGKPVQNRHDASHFERGGIKLECTNIERDNDSKIQPSQDLILLEEELNKMEDSGTVAKQQMPIILNDSKREEVKTFSDEDKHDHASIEKGHEDLSAMKDMGMNGVKDDKIDLKLNKVMEVEQKTSVKDDPQLQGVKEGMEQHRDNFIKGDKIELKLNTSEEQKTGVKDNPQLQRDKEEDMDNKREIEHDKPQLVADRPKAVDDNSEVKKCPAALGRLDTMGIMSEVMSQCLIAKVKSVLQKVEGDETAQDKGLREKKQIERHMLIDIT